MPNGSHEGYTGADHGDLRALERRLEGRIEQLEHVIHIMLQALYMEAPGKPLINPITEPMAGVLDRFLERMQH
jgi:hypothetical protein